MEIPSKSDHPPGCEEIFSSLASARESGRLPHALLFAGPAGLGKRQVAQTLATRILLGNKTADEQEQISALITAGTHPDLQEITPETSKKAISVDQIRLLTERLALTPQLGPSKIAILSPAESMTIAAANALLKTLEEPSGDALLILVTANLGRMPQTVRSRCQKVNFKIPPAEKAMSWLSNHIGNDSQHYLEMAQGAPLLAMAYQEESLDSDYQTLVSSLLSLLDGKADPLSVARQCQEAQPAQIVGWLDNIVHHLIRQKMGAEEASTVSTNMLNHLKISVDGIDLRKLFKYRDFLQQAKLESDANLNRELFGEEIFMRWSALSGP